jgi:hypothetical protein
MLPEFLLPETTIREAAAGSVIGLGDHQGGAFVLTLGITRILEQESLDLSVWGSSDGHVWGSRPLLTFPQKFYCGIYQVVLDLADRPDVHYVRAQWAVNRWGKGDAQPLFTISVALKELIPAAMVMGA